MPLRYSPRLPKPLTLDVLRACATVTSNGCWEWQRTRTRAGYGRVQFQGRTRLVHVVAHLLAGGSIPDGMEVMHSCDNPPCFNPAHLSAGNRLQNVHDMKEKGRERKALGEANGKRKLTEAHVEAIKLDPRTHRAIAPDYGVSHSCVASIKRGRTWAKKAEKP